MNSVYILTTILKTRDAVAATASYTLQHDMGFDGVVLSLIRQDYWRIELFMDGDSREPGAVMKELAEKTRVFVNPNKHRYVIRPEGSIAAGAVPNKPGRFEIPILVRGLEDHAGMNALKTLSALYQVGKCVRSVQNGVLWMLELQAESLDEARRIARQIATTTSRIEGLLANPHCESVFLL